MQIIATWELYNAVSSFMYIMHNGEDVRGRGLKTFKWLHVEYRIPFSNKLHLGGRVFIDR